MTQLGLLWRRFCTGLSCLGKDPSSIDLPIRLLISFCLQGILFSNDADLIVLFFSVVGNRWWVVFVGNVCSVSFYLTGRRASLIRMLGGTLSHIFFYFAEKAFKADLKLVPVFLFFLVENLRV